MKKQTFNCKDCGKNLGGSVSVKSCKAGKIQYFDCGWCGSKFRSLNDEPIEVTGKQSERRMSHNQNKSFLNERIPGAKIHIDGKFIGVVK